MLQVRVTDIWRGWFYCLEFITPEAEGRPPSDRRPG